MDITTSKWTYESEIDFSSPSRSGGLGDTDNLIT